MILLDFFLLIPFEGRIFIIILLVGKINRYLF